jgi:hypothetical protein
MTTETTTPEVVKEPVVIDQERVAKLTAELDEFNKELQTKVYPVKLEEQDTLHELIAFIEHDATWKNMEALGIIEVSKVLNAELDKGMKSGNIYMQSLPIQALSFFLSKVETKGLVAAQKHLSFVKPVEDALKLIKQDNDKLNQMDSLLSAVENGIEIEMEKPKDN